jgi:hypothetical protein
MVSGCDFAMVFTTTSASKYATPGLQLSALRLAGGLSKLPRRSIRCQPIYLSFQIWPLKCGHLKTKEIDPNIL